MMQKGLNWYTETICLSATVQSHPLIQADVVYFYVMYVVSFLPYQLESMVLKYDFENKKFENNFGSELKGTNQNLLKFYSAVNCLWTILMVLPGIFSYFLINIYGFFIELLPNVVIVC